MENKGNPKPLKRSSDFILINQKGKRYIGDRWLQLVVNKSEDGGSYFGMTISKKIGKAVIRNKFKRWIRNCVRSNKWPTKFSDKCVVFVFKPQAGDFYKTISHKDFVETFNSIVLRIGTN